MEKLFKFSVVAVVVITSNTYAVCSVCPRSPENTDVIFPNLVFVKGIGREGVFKCQKILGTLRFGLESAVTLMQK